jgi:transposase-like protein
VREIKAYGGLREDTKSRSSKYLTIIVEQDSRYVKSRLVPMPGFQWFGTSFIIIAGVELLRRIHSGRFNLGGLRLNDRNMLNVWNAVLTARQNSGRTAAVAYA